MPEKIYRYAFFSIICGFILLPMNANSELYLDPCGHEGTSCGNCNVTLTVNVSPADSGVIQICDKYVPSAYPDTKNFVLENDEDDSPVKRSHVAVFRAIPSPGYSYDHWEGFLNGVAPVMSRRLSASDDGQTATAVFAKN
jgi:hypothetical protein